MIGVETRNHEPFDARSPRPRAHLWQPRPSKRLLAATSIPANRISGCSGSAAFACSSLNSRTAANALLRPHRSTGRLEAANCGLLDCFGVWSAAAAGIRAFAPSAGRG